MFEFINFTDEEYRQRLERLTSLLTEKGLDLAILNAGVDLYYYTGSVLPLYLVVPVKGPAFLLARKAADRIRAEVRHLELKTFTGSRDLTKIFGSACLASGRIGFNSEASSYATVTRLLDFFHPGEAVDISMDLKFLRMRKSAAEIAIQEEAGRIIAGFPEVARRNFLTGMTELQLSQKIEEFFRLHGNEVISTKQEGLALAYGVAAAGENSLAGSKFDGICTGKGVSRSLPFGASRDEIPENVPLIMDYAFVFHGYHMDMTRMASRGQAPGIVLNAYNAMLRVEEAVIENLSPGKTWKEIWELAENLAAELGQAAVFMKSGRDRTRFVGHGVGLQLDEPPYLVPTMDLPLESGMTIAVEPKVALPGIGVVGIEDTVLVTDNKTRCLTECSREWIVL